MMLKFKKFLVVAGLLAAIPVAAYAAGFTTNGLPTLPLVGTTSNPGNYGQLMGNEIVAVDTSLPNGQNPQSVAANAFQIAAAAICVQNGVASTASGGAASGNGQCSLVTSESLSTAVNATYTLTLTNTAVTATSNVWAAAYLKGALNAGRAQVQSVTPASGSVVIVIKNVGTAAFAGALIIPVMVQ